MDEAIDSTENMDIDNPNLDEENVIKDLVQTCPKKSDDQKDVGTSLDQQDKQDDKAGTPVEDESEFKTTSENEFSSNNIGVNSL